MSPVPVDLLRSGRLAHRPEPESHPGRVLAFLQKHADKAWRAAEVAKALRTDQYTIGAALRRLRGRGLIDKEGPYWFALSERESAQLQMALAVTRAANERWGPEDPADWADLPHG